MLFRSRHRLILMTKGDRAEQADKLARSGLFELFSSVEIVAAGGAGGKGCYRQESGGRGRSPFRRRRRKQVDRRLQARLSLLIAFRKYRRGFEGCAAAGMRSL